MSECVGVLCRFQDYFTYITVASIVVGGNPTVLSWQVVCETYEHRLEVVNQGWYCTMFLYNIAPQPNCMWNCSPLQAELLSPPPHYEADTI